MNIIGISGTKRSGKTTAQKVFEKHGYKSLNFASALKDIVCRTFKINDNVLESLKDIQFKMPIDYNHKLLSYELSHELNADISINKDFYSYREFMQYIGTDIIRTYDKDWHINKLDKKIKSNTFGKYCIGDVRFPNEYDYIISNGGLMIHVVSLHKLHAKESDCDKTMQHISEEFIPPVCTFVINDYTQHFIDNIESMC